MKLNRKDLRKIQYDFNSFANRLLQANFQDYTGVLGKFLNYIDSTPIIIDFIKGCGECDWNLADEVNDVQASYGGMIFGTGDTEEEEIRNVYAGRPRMPTSSSPTPRKKTWKPTVWLLSPKRPGWSCAGRARKLPTSAGLS